ncbi:hypothetical protein G7085_13310 [Tessaracoccus sp. HDW20]|uniref:hypothetical protein n=1 Tax=Tessaracoccus coleopterorum TaxID=2714950 RepID=UPI0018D3D756|nr:hypothetical protein [Tessaracoccus coleopterorum]NHB85284.1 hypothetical protein [Tessaracoccus coleopterorum]
MPYYQPPIAEGMPRLPGLLLVVLAAADPTPAPRNLSRAERDAVREVLSSTMGSPSLGTRRRSGCSPRSMTRQV